MNEKKNSKYLFEEMPVPKALLKMAIPTVIGQLIVLIYNMADTFYVGKTDDPYMVAGVSLILPVFNTLIALSNLPGVGGGTYVSRLLGVGRTKEASAVSSFGIYLGITLAAIFSASVAVFMDPILRFLGAGENTYVYARQYVTYVIVFGGVPTVLANVMSNMLRSTGKSAHAGFGVALGGILNIVLDPLFMFVILPEGSEILGVAIATLLSNILSCIYYGVVLYTIRKDTIISLIPTVPEKSSIRRVFNVGLPACVTMLLFDVDYMIVDRLMAGYSDVALASIGIVLKGERFPLNVGVGISQGMVPIVAYNYASGNHERMRRTYRLAITAGVLTGIVSITLYELFAPYIMRFFINDAETVQLGAAFLRARSPATVFMFLSFSTTHLFQAFGQGRTALYLGIQRWLLLNIPMLFILNAFFGMYGIVWAQLCADLINAAISIAVFTRYNKKHITSV